MLDDAKRALLAHPVRKILLRAAHWRGARVDEQELSELSVDDATRDAVRQAVLDVSELADSGGLRARAKSERAAEQLAAGIVAAIPPEYADAVATGSSGTDDDDRDPGELAAAIRARQRGEDDETRATDLDDAERIRQALAQARGGTGE